MKKNNHTHLISILTLLLISFASCKEDLLPQPTQDGQNSLGCLIDGKSYVPNGGPAFSGIKPIYGGFLSIRANQTGIYIYTYAKDKQQIELYLNDFVLGMHQLNQNTGVMPANIYPKDYGLYRNDSNEEFVTSSNYTGWINITKADKATGIVSGTFEFQASTATGKIVNITKGRFDVNARTQ